MSNWNVAKPSELKALLASHGFAFKKQLGQNFLIDGHILDRIVEAAELTENDGAFEIGPGAGVVTQRLAAAVKRVVAVEKDAALANVLRDSLAGQNNVELVMGDVLKVSLETLWERFVDCDRVSVVANLPYYVTTPILFHILESAVQPHNIVVMVQKEVADRMCASPGTKDYGVLSISVQYHAEVDKVAKVTPGSFMPPPTVDSTVIRLRCRPNKAVSVLDEGLFFRVVRAAFGTRRKTLQNSLAGSSLFDKSTCIKALETSGIDGVRRGETLSISEFADLANAFVQLQTG